MLKIGEFSKFSNITIKMLRHYDEIGLLTPDYVDTFTGYRHYAASQLGRAQKILAYKALGFPLATIKVLLESENDQEVLAQHFRLREMELAAEQQELKRKAALFAQMSERIHKNQPAAYAVALKTIPQRHVISLRRQVPTYADEGQLWGELFQFIEANKVQTQHDGYTMALYHDPDFQEENVDIELQQTVSGGYTGTDAIHFLETEEILTAAVTFNGSYDQMPDITQAIALWIEQNGYELSGPMLNIFHVSAAQNPNPDEWITEACYAIQKKNK